MREAGIADGFVHEAVAADFEEERGDGEEGHDGDGAEGLLDLEAHLVLEVFRVVEGGFVEDEDVGEGGEGEVDDCAEEPAWASVRHLPGKSVARRGGLVLTM